MTNLEEYIERVLKNTQDFLALLEYNHEIRYPKFAVIYGNCWPTIASFHAKKKINDVIELQWPKQFCKGDGVVPEKSSDMPSGYTFKKFNSFLLHPFLMRDVESISRALYWMKEGW